MSGYGEKQDDPGHIGWCYAEQRANARRNTLISGNGAVLAFKRWRSCQIVRMDLKSDKDVDKMATSEAANGKSVGQAKGDRL